MNSILLFGAGKSATVLIDYLVKETPANGWLLTIADANKEVILEKTGNSPHARAVQLDITNEAERQKLIRNADVVISLMPPSLHFLIAKDCVQFEKHLLTASYVDDNIKSLQKDIEAKNLLFLCEMGLDPGIDHMSAMKLIEDIKSRGGKITSFKSHCGGLVAPESNDNPWQYKISWNPRNIVMAGKAGALYKLNNTLVTEKYEELFDGERFVEVPEIGQLAYYPNRDSVSYIDTYQLQDAVTFIRTTLRYPDFMYGWKNVIELKLTDETPVYETDSKTLADFFKEHMDAHGFGDWLTKKLTARFEETKNMLEKLMELMKAEEEAAEAGEELPDEIMAANEKGELQTINLENMKDNAAGYVAHQMHESNLTLKQLFFLGMDDDETGINKGKCSAADVLQFALEKKLALQPDDKDMIVMLHEIEYELNGSKHKVTSSLMVKGEDSLRTAMAKTVGLPLGIAAKLILNGAIKERGLHIPIQREIYEPVLKELEKFDVKFIETGD